MAGVLNAARLGTNRPLQHFGRIDCLDRGCTNNYEHGSGGQSTLEADKVACQALASSKVSAPVSLGGNPAMSCITFPPAPSGR
jgi:hypothetical protein